MIICCEFADALISLPPILKYAQVSKSVYNNLSALRLQLLSLIIKCSLFHNFIHAMYNYYAMLKSYITHPHYQARASHLKHSIGVQQTGKHDFLKYQCLIQNRLLVCVDYCSNLISFKFKTSVISITMLNMHAPFGNLSADIPPRLSNLFNVRACVSFLMYFFSSIV